MKKLTLILFALLLSLFHCGRLQAKTAPIENKSLPIIFPVSAGDTLWHIAGTYYGNPMKYHFLMEVNGIVDARRLQIGTLLAIPSSHKKESVTTVPEPKVNTFTNARPILTTNSFSEFVLDAPAFETELSAEPIQPASVIQPAAPAMIPVQLLNKKKVKGYELIVLGENGRKIPARQNLETCLIFFDSEDDRRAMRPSYNRDWDCNHTAWAEPNKDGDTSLKVSIKQLPDEPFDLLIGGVANPIDGTWFSQTATPFGERFPGKPRFKSFLVQAGQSSARGATIALMTGNPFIGLGAAAAPFALQGGQFIWHHVFKKHHHNDFAKRTINSKEISQ